MAQALTLNHFVKSTLSVLALPLLLVTLAAAPQFAHAQYQVGDRAVDFRLKNVDGNMVSLRDYPSAKGAIVVFTCNHCPFSKAYEERIIALHKKYAPLGYPVIAINPNDPRIEPADSYAKMQERAKAKKFPFAYLVDETQSVAKTYGATRTPHVYVLQKQADGSFTVGYIGAIDDNSDTPKEVKAKYVQEAVDALLKGQKPSTASTKAVGCGIKWRK
jgi:peroxiredoxin